MVVLMLKQLGTVMVGIDLIQFKMNSTHFFLLESLKAQPIGETGHFVWFITDIVIAALFKGNENLKIYNLNVEKEAKI